MLKRLLLVVAAAIAVSQPAWGRGEYMQVVIDDPFIELHTGPGRGYPIFYVAERGEQVDIMKRRTEWFKIKVERGAEGWVHLDQLRRTFDLEGKAFDVPVASLEDYAEKRWEVGALYGDFGGANVISAYGAYNLTPNLSLELGWSQALGTYSDSQIYSLNIAHLMFPDRRVSPFFTLGTGRIQTTPKATLVDVLDRRDALALAGIGVRTYLTRRFLFRAEYKTYVVFTSRDDNEEIREWKAGFSFFF